MIIMRGTMCGNSSFCTQGMSTAAARLTQAGGLLLQVHTGSGVGIWVFPPIALACVNSLKTGEIFL